MVARVEGLALGGGLELAVSCDFIVCSERARLGLPEIRVAAFPASAGTLRATRRIGAGRAKELMLRGDFVGTATALSWGLVNRVVPAGQVLPQALQYARRFAAGSASVATGARWAVVQGV